VSDDRAPKDWPDAPAAGGGEARGPDARPGRSDTLHEAERAIEERVLRDARSIRVALPELGHGLIAAVLGAHAAATVALCFIVFAEPFPYPVMYPLMGLIAWLFLAIRFTAWVAGRRVSAAALLVFNLLLTTFWVFVLGDQVPARVVAADGLVARPDLPILWVPIALYALSAALLVTHATTRWRRPR